MPAFWDIEPCSLVEIGGCSRDLRLPSQARCPETSVSFYQTTRRNNPDDSNLHKIHRENLKYHQHLHCLRASNVSLFISQH
jgi:hypothetical protein